MLLSIIIVNYNVKYFLEQCLYSVQKALRMAGLEELQAASYKLQGGEAKLQATSYKLQGEAGGLTGRASAEVIVFDNASTDGSREYLPPKFPRVRFLFNEENIGFGAANNQALAQSGGEYVLFLNPDTILPERFFENGLDFMRAHPGAGAVGFRMIDGGGRYLRESRRGYPSPWVAFCKLAGLTALFPHSRLFAGYYLGHLPEDRNVAAPILSGACLLVKREALERTGGFDERFFMYAEDIDLSHRIGEAGFINYYIADSPILHFKGESTRKDVRYIRLFYKAMSQFRRKHSGKGLSRVGNRIMDAAIWFRAGITATAHLFYRRSGAENMEQGPGRGPAWLMGDPKTTALLKARLSGMGRALAASPGEASEIILCEGDEYSFGQIIACLQEGKGVQEGNSARAGMHPVFMIHAAGSSSFVGSPSKEGQGEAQGL